MATKATKRPNTPKSKQVKTIATKNERPTKTVDVAGLPDERTVAEAFASIEEIRKSVKPLPEGMTVKDLIEEGRR
ncbi:MAG TPA: hypothetical protein VGM18_06225 [Candidatus Sulfotelmatobacter sp.]